MLGQPGALGGGEALEIGLKRYTEPPPHERDMPFRDREAGIEITRLPEVRLRGGVGVAMKGIFSSDEGVDGVQVGASA